MQYPPISPPSNALDRLGQRYLTYWHGEGEPHQYRYFRCKGCRSLVTWKQIRSGGCACDLDHRMGPAKLSLFDKLRILVLPWTI